MKNMHIASMIIGALIICSMAGYVYVLHVERIGLSNGWKQYEDRQVMHFAISYPASAVPQIPPSQDDQNAYSLQFGNELIVSVMPYFPQASSSLKNFGSKDTHRIVRVDYNRTYILWFINPIHEAEMLRSFIALP